MITLDKLSRELNNNGYIEASKTVQEVYIEDKNRQIALTKWAKVINKSQDKLNLQYALEDFDKAIRLSVASQSVNHYHLKQSLLKIADNYFENIKVAGIFSWLGDLGRGAWENLLSPFGGMVDKGAYKRLHTMIQNDFIEKVNNFYEKLSGIPEEDTRSYNIIFQKLIDYLSQSYKYFRQEGTKAVRSNNSLNIALSRLMIIAIDSFFKHIRNEEPLNGVLSNFIRSCWDILLGMSNQSSGGIGSVGGGVSNVGRQNSEVSDVGDRTSVPSHTNEGVEIPESRGSSRRLKKPRENYYVRGYRYDDFKKHHSPDVVNDVNRLLGIPLDRSKWTKPSSDNRYATHYIPVEVLYRFMQNYPNGYKIVYDLVGQTDFQNWKEKGIAEGMGIGGQGFRGGRGGMGGSAGAYDEYARQGEEDQWRYTSKMH